MPGGFGADMDGCSGAVAEDVVADHDATGLDELATGEMAVDDAVFEYQLRELGDVHEVVVVVVGGQGRG